MEEIWKDIPGYEGYYEISNTGKYRSVDRQVIRKDGIIMHIKGKELKFSIDRDGYAFVNLTKNGKSKSLFAHRLVCKVFLQSFNPELTVNHIDGNKLNNCIYNLEMVTIQENINHYNTSSVFEKSRENKANKSSYTQKGVPKSRDIVEKQRISLLKYYETHDGPRKGASLNQDTKNKIAFAQSKHVHCIETDQYFISCKQASEFYHVDISSIIDWCKKRFDKTSKLYPELHFEFTDEQDLSKYTILDRR